MDLHGGQYAEDVRLRLLVRLRLDGSAAARSLAGGATKRIMNMRDWAKQKDGLVEAIYATMSGNIYFFDAETGQETRDHISTAFPFKGAGALDPRGYPLMYVGSGDDSPTEGKDTSHAFIISLIDGSVLYEFGKQDSFRIRGLSYFDSSALVDAETDTLIYPGESGILYLIKLNTNYDEAAGTISISPKVTKWRYKGAKNNTDGVAASRRLLARHGGQRHDLAGPHDNRRQRRPPHVHRP